MSSAVAKADEQSFADTNHQSSSPPQTVARRHDLDGLRAFAIALVVGYHIWVGRVSGGVDVFLLLSAYFMTASLVRKAEHKKLGLGRYWLNRFWSLVPLAALTIGAVLWATYVFLPSSAWENIWSQAWASLFYFQNWELASNAVDYYARDTESISPLLHFWSLSVQGQVFILWPLLLLLCVGLARVFRVHIRAVATGAFGAIFVLSLTYSIWITATDQTVAYYDTGARLWEFAIGSLVALIPLRSLNRKAAEVIGWISILALLTCGMVLDVSGGFPGYLALWPCLAAVGIVVAGTNQQTSVARLLGSAPMRRLGKVAYPLYLAHWPLLVFTLVVTGRESAGPWLGTLIVAVSLLIAIVAHLLVDKPLHKLIRPTGRGSITFIALVASFAVVAVSLTSWQRIEADKAASITAEANPGAAVLDDPELTITPEAPLLPLGSQLSAEWFSLEELCSGRFRPQHESTRKDCTQTLVSPSAPTLMVVGDSHAQQWMWALQPIAASHGWNVVAALKGACSFALKEPTVGNQAECDEWRRDAVDYVNQVKPDIVFTMGSKTVESSPNETALHGLDETIAAIQGAVGQIILMRDQPRYDFDMFTCAVMSQADETAGPMCDTPVDELLGTETPLDRFVSADVHVVDMTSVLCPEDLCRAIIGNVAVYIDDNHIGGTFIRSAEPILARRLDEAGVQW